MLKLTNNIKQKTKKIISSTLLVLAFGFTNAQKAPFGIRMGLNSSDFIGGTKGANFKSGVGFDAGVFTAIKFPEKITLQPEILFSKQGAEEENIEVFLDDLLFTGDVKFNLSYLNVPVMVKFYVADKFNL